MAQFAPKTHPAREHMLALSRALPTIWTEFDKLRSVQTYSPQVYVSDFDAGTALASAMYEAGGQRLLMTLRENSPLSVAMRASNAATLAAWRMTQGIYRLDPALYADLVGTPLAGDIPADVLMRLPEWCIYIETPGLRAVTRDGEASLDVLGAWVRLDFPDARRMLVMTLDIAGADAPQPHALELKGTVEEAVQAIADEYAAAGLVQPADGWMEATGRVAEYVTPIINLLLYICSTTDISGKRGQPGNPAPVRTRRDGWRLFPAEGLRTWDVGVRMGAALRAAYQAAETGGAGGEHSGPRGHVRRAHWHGFRSGARKREDGSEIPLAQRRFDLRWLPPIPVNLGDVDQLPAVVRPVK